MCGDEGSRFGGLGKAGTCDSTAGHRVGQERSKVTDPYDGRPRPSRPPQTLTATPSIQIKKQDEQKSILLFLHGLLAKHSSAGFLATGGGFKLQFDVSEPFGGNVDVDAFDGGTSDCGHHRGGIG